jgi:hypothetical protein
MAKQQTEVEKAIARIDAARQDGLITKDQAQRMRRMARGTANDGRLDPNTGKIIDARLERAQGRNPGTEDPVDDGGETEEERLAREAEELRLREEELRNQSRPGQAWEWNGTRWVRPNKPTDGQPYEWDDNLGWQVDTNLMNSRTNARGYLQGLFKQFGFDDSDTNNLMGMVDEWIRTGLADSGTEPVLMKFRDTDIYKRRFAGMAELIKRGQAISEAEYIQLESSYRNVMQNYGLPTTFYDRPEDYARLIGAGLSVNEVEQRVVAAKQSLNPLVAQELEQYYGVSQGTAMAYLLGLTDEKGVAVESARTQEQIRTGARAAQIGAAAERAGFNMDRAYAERLGGTSVGQTVDPFQMGTLANLEGTFDQARRIADRETTLAAIDTEAYDQRDALSAAFGDEQKKLASERRARRERARFSGSSGAAASSLGVERNL